MNCMKSDRELAADCGTWQQLDFMKRRRQAIADGTLEKKDLSESTRSERLLWYRNNKEAVDSDRELASQCSNYKQLQILRGNGVLAKGDWEKTRSNRLMWFRNGGSELVDQERELAKNCKNWEQFYLLTRGPSCRRKGQDIEEEEEEDILPTRSEKLMWYRYGGGKQIVEEQQTLASNSENWMQYKLTRDARSHSDKLYDAVQRSYSDFKSKEALSAYMFGLSLEGMEERQDIRHHTRTRYVTDTMSKIAYGLHLKPYVGEEIESAMSRSLAVSSKMTQLQEKLRCTTESLMTARNEYAQSTRELAMQAVKEDAEAVAASRVSRKTIVVENQAVSSAA